MSNYDPRPLDGVFACSLKKEPPVILTDMFGGTPSNLAIAAMEKTGAEVIAGVNLPKLVKLASVRAHWPLKEAVAAAHEAGRKYINVASWVLNGERK